MSSVVLFIAGGDDKSVELHPGTEEENPFGTYTKADFNSLDIGESGSGFIGVTHTKFSTTHQALVTIYDLVNDRFETPLDTGLDVGEEAEVVVKGKTLRILHNKEEVV